ncbi:hypothetical protein [Bacillus thuringiensis]|uniref:hypothetical protein n=1 Tax=Bacillus thuringiensis TaxID=1428 RepID=UPI000BFC021A|nr:hypothetical protein [Bacillus thuringiensis]PGM47447.1 hypothetical protein CN937_04010 [Bacillus thuringiensis]
MVRITFTFASGVDYLINTTGDIALKIQESMSNKESTLIWLIDGNGDRVEIIKKNILYVKYEEDDYE